MIKSFSRVLLLLIFFMFALSMSSRPAIDQLTDLDHHNSNKGGTYEGKTHGDIGAAKPRTSTVQSAGSRLPDCSHACGSCMPCRLVIVGSACASLTEAESCPISYRCMCNNKTYPVP